MNLNHKRFITAANKNGLSSEETIFYYSENKEGIITAAYHGGSIAKGHILGKRIEKSNTIKLIYHCITKDGELKAGEAKGIVTKNEDEKLLLKLKWKWLNGEPTSGTSEYIEIN